MKKYLLKHVFTKTNMIIVAGVALDLINQWGNLFPDVKLPPSLISIAVFICAWLPGLRGQAHKLMTGEAQMPEHRDIPQVVAATEATKGAIIAETPKGRPVPVPETDVVIAKGEKPGGE